MVTAALGAVAVTAVVEVAAVEAESESVAAVELESVAAASVLWELDTAVRLEDRQWVQ